MIRVNPKFLQPLRLLSYLDILNLHLTMAPPDTGRYTITNVKFMNLAVLPDANDDSDVVARTEENNAGEKVRPCLCHCYSVAYLFADQWNITLLNNKKYTIKNHGFSNFAGCETRADKGDSVRGRERNKQWIIKETRVKGQFT